MLKMSEDLEVCGRTEGVEREEDVKVCRDAERRSRW